MQYAALDRWSRGSSAIHRLDPRAKIGALLVFLVVVATTHRGLPLIALSLLALLVIAILTARLPLVSLMLRATMVVLLFTFTVSVASVLAGDPDRALTVILKSYLSALAVILVVAATPIPLLLRGLEACGVPPFLLLVSQFVYRYLFVITEEARHMRTAAASRGAPLRFRGAAAAVAALFARSHARAEEIHRAMLARGFLKRFRTLDTLHFRPADAAFLLGASLALLLIRAAVESISA